MSKGYKELLKEFYDDYTETLDYKLEPASIKPSGVEYINTGMVNEHDLIMDMFDEAIVKSKQSNADMVNNPPHYNQGGIETIDYMKAYSSKEEYQGHLRLTAIKYLSRSGKKYDRAEDLKKGAWYLNKLIEDVKERG